MSHPRDLPGACWHLGHSLPVDFEVAEGRRPRCKILSGEAPCSCGELQEPGRFRQVLKEHLRSLFGAYRENEAEAQVFHHLGVVDYLIGVGGVRHDAWDTDVHRLCYRDGEAFPA